MLVKVKTIIHHNLKLQFLKVIKKKLVCHILKYIFFNLNIFKHVYKHQIKEDWKFAAMVIDRFLFYVFTFLLIVGTTAILL